MTADIRTRAAGYGRRVRSASCPFVLWPDAEREAEAEKRRIIDEADDVALANWARGLGLESGSFDDFTKEMFVIGGGALPIVGTPEQVADKLAQLYRSGVDAVLMIFLSFHDDTVRFGRDIVPLLRQLDVVKQPLSSDADRSRPSEREHIREDPAPVLISFAKFGDRSQRARP